MSEKENISEEETVRQPESDSETVKQDRVTDNSVEPETQITSDETELLENPFEAPAYLFYSKHLSGRAEKVNERLAALQDKHAAFQGKIEIGREKIDKWKAKIADAEKTIAYCQELLDTQALPKPMELFFTAMKERQDAKIKRLNDKIDRKEQRIDVWTNKQKSCREKAVRLNSKFSKLMKIDNFMKNMRSSIGRRENFLQAIKDLRETALNNALSKRNKLEEKIEKATAALLRADTSVERVKIKSKLKSMGAKKDNLDEKIENLRSMTDKLNGIVVLPHEETEQLISQTADNVENTVAFAPEEMTAEELTDAVVDTVEKSVDDYYEYTQIYEVEQYGEVRFYKANNLRTEDLLKAAANMDNPFMVLGSMGKPISIDEYAAFQQSSKFRNSIEINLDDKTVRFYTVNNGEGGIDEINRNRENTVFSEHSLSEYVANDNYDYTVNGIQNEYMKYQVKSSNGDDKMKYLDHLSREEVDFLFIVKEKYHLEFAVFDAIPNTSNMEKAMGYTVAYRRSNEDGIVKARKEFKMNQSQTVPEQPQQSEQSQKQQDQPQQSEQSQKQQDQPQQSEPSQKQQEEPKQSEQEQKSQTQSEKAPQAPKSDFCKISQLKEEHIAALTAASVPFSFVKEKNGTHTIVFSRDNSQKVIDTLSSAQQKKQGQTAAHKPPVRKK